MSVEDIRKEYEEEYQRFDRGYIRYSEWLEDKLIQANQQKEKPQQQSSVQEDYKLQEKFEKWYVDTYEANPYLPTFYALGSSFQWGVLQLFADSEGYDLCASQYDLTLFGWELFKGNTMIDEGFAFKTRPEAWEAAVKKLNEILNEK